jgi:hypothetical protein
MATKSAITKNATINKWSRHIISIDQGYVHVHLCCHRWCVDKDYELWRSSSHMVAPSKLIWGERHNSNTSFEELSLFIQDYQWHGNWKLPMRV